MESKNHESLYSHRVKAGKRRTYFFDVRETRGGDYFVTLTESKKNFDDGSYDRHRIFLYKEDFNRFLAGLDDVVNHIKTELMPDYDYDEFTRRYDDDDQSGDNTSELSTSRDSSPDSKKSASASEPGGSSDSEVDDDPSLDDVSW